MSATGVVPKELVSNKINGRVTLDIVVKVCCALNNVLEGVVPFV